MKSRMALPDPFGAVIPPVYNTTTFEAGTAAELAERFQVLLGRRQRKPDESPFMYSRFGTPNSEFLERELLAMEKGAKHALVFNSGMSAITTMILSLLKPGSTIVYTNPVYGCTEDFFSHVCPRFGIKAYPVDTSGDLARVEREIRKRRPSLVFLETPSNPCLGLSDIRAIAKLARRFGRTNVRVAVDNTFLGPLFQSPLTCGADIVVYSMTKFLGGHSDVLGGAAMTKYLGDYRKILGMRHILGTILPPYYCAEVTRSNQTLRLRMNEQAHSAGVIVNHLVGHPKVEQVCFPGLMRVGERNRYLVPKQCGNGSMVSFYIKGGRQAAFRFLDRLKVFTLAVSLGGTHSLAIHPASTTHAGVSQRRRLAGDVTDSLVRLSIGTESAQALIDDLDQALK